MWKNELQKTWFLTIKLRNRSNFLLLIKDLLSVSYITVLNNIVNLWGHHQSTNMQISHGTYNCWSPCFCTNTSCSISFHLSMMEVCYWFVLTMQDIDILHLSSPRKKFYLLPHVWTSYKTTQWSCKQKDRFLVKLSICVASKNNWSNRTLK